MGSPDAVQAGLELLDSREPPTSASEWRGPRCRPHPRLEVILDVCDPVGLRGSLAPRITLLLEGAAEDTLQVCAGDAALLWKGLCLLPSDPGQGHQAPEAAATAKPPRAEGGEQQKQVLVP